MILERLKVDGFGKFRKVDVALVPGLNLIHGGNGVGKSTLLAFVRAMLFGFQKEGTGQRFEPHDGGAFGGEVSLRLARGALSLRRMGGGKTRYEGELSARAVQGDAFAGESPAQILGEALGGVGPALFNEVFAFGLSELEDFTRLRELGSVSEALFAAGMGAQHLPAALKALTESSKRLYVPSGRTTRLNLVLHEISNLRDTLAAQEDRPAAYAAKKAELARITAELGELGPRKTALLRERSELGRLLAAHPLLQEMRALERQWKPQQHLLEAVPVEAVTRLEELERRLQGARAELSELTAARTRAELEANDLRPELPDQAPRIAAALAAARAWQGGAQVREGLAERRASARTRRAQVIRSLQDLGLDAESGSTLDASAPARAELAGLVTEERALAQARSDADTVSRRLSLGRKQLAVTRARLEEQRRGFTGAPLDVLRARESSLSLLPRLESDVARAAQAVELLESQSPAPRIEQGPGMRELMLVALAAFVVVVLTGFLGGVRTLLPVALLAGLALSVMGVLARRAQRARDEAVAREAAVKSEQERSRARALEMLAVARRECSRVALAAGLPDALGASEIEDAIRAVRSGIEDALEAARLDRELQGLGEGEQDLHAEERELAEQMSLLDARAEGFAGRLAEFLSARGLGTNFNAEQAAVLLLETSRVQALLEACRMEEAELAAVEQRLQDSAAAVLAGADAIGLSASSPEQAVISIQRDVEELERTRARRRVLEGEASLRMDATARGAAREAEALVELERLLAAADCESPEALRRRAAELEGLRPMRDRARKLQVQVETAFGDSAAAAEARLESLGGEPAAASRAAELEDTLAAVESRERAILETQGRYRAELAAFENEDADREARSQLAELRVRAERLSRELAVERIALGLLQHAKGHHERERQPAVIRRTSRFFAELSDGQYRNVVTNLDAPSEVLAEDENGERWPAGKLSRGTREQLYLAFRLALVEELAEKKGPLPLLVDDILVNFDAPRTTLAIRVLERMGARHQILFFTCHEHLCARFAALGAHVVDVSELGSRQLTLRTA